MTQPLLELTKNETKRKLAHQTRQGSAGLKGKEFRENDCY